MGARCPTSPLTNAAVTDGGSTAMAQDWHSPSNVLLRGMKVMDEGITAWAQYCRSLSNVALTDTGVTDDGTTAWAQHWQSRPNLPPLDRHGGHGRGHHVLDSVLSLAV